MIIRSQKPRNKIIESYLHPPYENLLLLDMPDEKWKPFPISPFDQHYVVSNKGRVKRLAHNVLRTDGIITFIPEKIIKQTKRYCYNCHLKEKSYTLMCKVTSDGKCSGVTTARVIYHAFIEPFDLYDRDWYIRYKDGNGLNCLPENLYLFERRKLTKWVQDNGRRISRQGASDRSKYSEEEVECWDNAIRKTVSQYDLKGHLIKLFKSRKDAADAVGVTLSRISAAIKGKSKTAGGYIWREGSENSPQIDVPSIVRSIRVAQYSPEGNLIQVFPTIKNAAENINLSTSVISDRLYGRSSQRDFILKAVDFFQKPLIKITDELPQTKAYSNHNLEIPEGKSYPFQNFSPDDMPNEEWKEIPNTDNVYQVSNMGRVKSVNRMMKTVQCSYLKRGQILCQSIKRDKKTNRPMLFVQLKVKNKITGYHMPNLVNRFFNNGETSRKYTVKFIDNDPLNCKAENLKSQSTSDRFKQYIQEGRIQTSRKNKPVAQYSLDGKHIATYSSITEAGNKTGYSKGHISSCVRGKKETLRGFVWKYLVK